MAQKKKIYYARTYRRLRTDVAKMVLYFCLIVLPVLLIFVFNITNITELLSWLAVKLLGEEFPGVPVQIIESEFSILGTINVVELPNIYPAMNTVLVNLLIVGILLLFCSSGKRKGKPVSIFLTIGLVVHLINCIYFIFASNSFPYSAYQYSDLYIKQQVGIWLVFIILAGMVTGCVGAKGFGYKIAGFLSIILYSFVFGFVRYLLFLYIIEQFSVLYMALMFFVLGPFFDFVYLVGIYAVFLNRMVKLYDSYKGKEEWLWS